MIGWMLVGLWLLGAAFVVVYMWITGTHVIVEPWVWWLGGAFGFVFIGQLLFGKTNEEESSLPYVDDKAHRREIWEANQDAYRRQDELSRQAYVPTVSGQVIDDEPKQRPTTLREELKGIQTEHHGSYLLHFWKGKVIAQTEKKTRKGQIYYFSDGQKCVFDGTAEEAADFLRRWKNE